MLSVSMSRNPSMLENLGDTNLLDVSAAAPGCKDEECGEGYLGAQVALTSDADGTLYALWSAGNAAQGAQRIYFSSSTNGGDSWLPKISVSYADAGVEHAFPAIVAGASGDVRIAWMDRRRSPDWNTYYRSSSNGGATWGEEFASPATYPATATSTKRFPLSLWRLLQYGHRQPQRYPHRVGRRSELSVARINLARCRSLDCRHDRGRPRQRAVRLHSAAF